MIEMLSTRGLRKVYGDVVAVDGISFDVRPNEIVGLLGPNGAGKTTTINMVLGVLQPDAGTIRIEGLDLARNRSQAIARTNFAAVYTPLPGNLTVYQNLRVFGLLYEVKDLPKRLNELLKQFDLEAFRDKKCGVLSSGEQTRVSLAKAMLNHPKLLLLDEPTSNIDVQAETDFYDFLHELSEKMAIILVTHDTGAISSHVKTIGCINKTLHYHGEKNIPPKVFEKLYGCPIELIGHGIPHRVLKEHED